jgi:hypothetical protein
MFLLLLLYGGYKDSDFLHTKIFEFLGIKMHSCTFDSSLKMKSAGGGAH